MHTIDDLSFKYLHDLGYSCISVCLRKLLLHRSRDWVWWNLRSERIRMAALFRRQLRRGTMPSGYLREDQLHDGNSRWTDPNLSPSSLLRQRTLCQVSACFPSLTHRQNAYLLPSGKRPVALPVTGRVPRLKVGSCPDVSTLQGCTAT